MAKNPNLIPTVITDVNGKTTTVHKKLQPLPMITAIPATQLPDDTRKNRIRYILDTVSLLGEPTRLARTALHTASGETLATIAEAVSEESPIARDVAEHVIRGVAPSFIEDCIRFQPEMGVTDFNEASSYLRSLKSYTEFRSAKPFHDFPDDKREQALAVIKATRTIIENSGTDYTAPSHPIAYENTNTNWDIRTIKNRRILGMIIQQPQDAETIGTIMAKHGNMEPAAITAIMDGTLPALADGAL